MILDWAKSDFSTRDQLLGVVFDAGLIRRTDAKTLLNVDENGMVYRVRQARRDGLLQHKALSGHHAGVALALTNTGVAYMQKMLEISGRARAMTEQISHQLQLNDILLRYIKKYGKVGAQWYSTREATDFLAWLRRDEGDSEAIVKSTLIRPDGLLKVNATNSQFWVEFDNSTESYHQLTKKFRMYDTSLRRQRLAKRCVVWVAKSQSRREELKRVWRDFIFYDDENATEKRLETVDMRFFASGEETDFLSRKYVSPLNPNLEPIF